MPYTSILTSVPDGLVERVREAVERLRAGAEHDNPAALIAEAVQALEATRAHVLAENLGMLSHFIEMVTHPERAEGSGH